ISAPLVQGQPQNAAPINRVPAAPIERLIIAAVRKHLELNAEKVGPNGPDPIAAADLIATHIARVEVKQHHLDIQLHKRQSDKDKAQPLARDHNRKAKPLATPWAKPPSKQRRQIVPPAGPSSRQDQRPIRAETRAKLIAAIARARQWLDELIAGTMQNVEQLADREKCRIRQVNRTMTLAFLAPGLIQAAVDGRLPRGIGVARLRDLPTEWVSQYERLGLARPEPCF